MSPECLPETFEKWNYGNISKEWTWMGDTTHGAYAISEYDEVYASLVCNTLYWKLRTACLLTDNFKQFIPSRIFDRTKDDEMITELWRGLEFLTRFSL